MRVGDRTGTNPMASLIKMQRFIATIALLLPLPWLATAIGVVQSADRPTVDEHFRQTTESVSVAGFHSLGGQWKVDDGVVSVGPGPGPKLVLDNTVISIGKIGAEVLFTDNRGGNVGLLVKVTDADVGADRWSGYEVSLYADKQKLHLARHRQNYEPIGFFPCNVPVGEWIPFTVEMTETTLKVYVQGKLVQTYEDKEHPLTTGQIAFRPWQREAHYRNLWIEQGGRRRDIALASPSNKGPVVCRNWAPRLIGEVQGDFSLATKGVPSQQIRFVDGRGEVGIEHRAHDGTGMSLAAGDSFSGYVWAKSNDTPAELFVGLGTLGKPAFAESKLMVQPGVIQEIPFSLVAPNACGDARFAIALRSPGSVDVSRACLEPDDPNWPEDLRREHLPSIAVITRHPLSAPNAVGLDLWMSQPRAPGCSIRLVDPARPGLPARTIFEDPEGCIYDMNLSDDAQTIFFSYRRKGEAHWHLWRINVDGSGLRQLTEGPFYDVSPCPMPNGDVVFVSTRRFGHTVCQPGPSSNLYCMTDEGDNVRCVSMNTLSDFSPQMLPDGRVLFTRWEYIDRDLTYRQSLWTQYPDGTVYQLYFGNTVRDVGTFWQARPLPGRNDRVVATFAPHHGFPHGAIGLIDRASGPEEPRGEGFRYITPGFSSIGDRRHEWAYRDPFPLSERSFLCSYGDGKLQRFRIHLLDADGHTRLLYEDPVQSCYFPIPVEPKAIPVTIPDRVDAVPNAPDSTEENPTGTVLLADVYQGPGASHRPRPR